MFSHAQLRLCRLVPLFAVLVHTLTAQTAPAPRTQQAQLSSTRSQMAQALSPSVTDYSIREANASAAVKANLVQLRRKILESGAHFTIRYTAATDVPLELLDGTVIPRELPKSVVTKVNTRAKLLEAEISRSRAAALLPPQTSQISCSATAKSFDLRKVNKVTGVRTQICGTCWDFTAMATFEGSYAIQNNQLIDTSEQYSLNCAKAGNCSGGWWMPVFDFLIQSGAVDEAADPFTGDATLACPTNLTPKYKAAAWGFVGSNVQDIPSPAAIKQALCDHGPLATAIYVDPAFQSYGGGVFDEHTQSFTWINHGITIIGWDDTQGPSGAWLIKNSWGHVWGDTAGFGTETGYGWVAYNTNNIGTATAWVDALQSNVPLSPQWKKIIEDPQFKTPLNVIQGHP